MKHIKLFTEHNANEASEASIHNTQRVRELFDLSDDVAKELTQKLDYHFMIEWSKITDEELKKKAHAVAELEDIKLIGQGA